MSIREWPSLADRTVWTPAEMRREAQSQVFAARPSYVEPPRVYGSSGLAVISSSTFFYGNAAIDCQQVYSLATHSVVNIGRDCR